MEFLQLPMFWMLATGMVVFGFVAGFLMSLAGSAWVGKRLGVPISLIVCLLILFNGRQVGGQNAVYALALLFFVFGIVGSRERNRTAREMDDAGQKQFLSTYLRLREMGTSVEDAWESATESSQYFGPYDVVGFPAELHEIERRSRELYEQHHGP